ncbi:ABC transporter permease, partial [bacterium]|nr:ABC transporter permease [bacterium]
MRQSREEILSHSGSGARYGHVMRARAGGVGMWQGWVQVFRHRSLWFNLIGLDQKIRYKNTFVGFLWSFLNPLLLMAVFVVVFGQVGRFSEAIESYPIFLLTGLLPWQFFTASLLGASLSFRSATDLVTKAAFPRQIIPLASVATNLINFLYSLVILIGFFAVSGPPMTPNLLYVPLIIFFQFIM